MNRSSGALYYIVLDVAYYSLTLSPKEDIL